MSERIVCKSVLMDILNDVVSKCLSEFSLGLGTLEGKCGKAFDRAIAGSIKGLKKRGGVPVDYISGILQVVRRVFLMEVNSAVLEALEASDQKFRVSLERVECRMNDVINGQLLGGEKTI